jgi:hypothetical protein
LNVGELTVDRLVVKELIVHSQRSHE